MSTELKELKLDEIIISRTNPRKHFDEDAINEMAQSIIEKGVIQPIVVRKAKDGKKYELVCGERRYRGSLSARIAKKTITTIPAVIRELTDDEALELQIIENLQRKDVHPMEEAVAFHGLMVMKKFDVQEIAKRIGKGPQYVAQRLKLNDLVEEFQKAFYQDRMTLTDSIKVSKLSSIDQKELWKEEYADDSGKIQIGKWELQKYTNDLNDAPFNTADNDLKKDMGACTGCQFNSASNALLFPDSAHEATCMNSQCFKQKTNLSYDRELKKSIDDPAVVLVTDEYSSCGKSGKELIGKGHTVYLKNQYTEEYKPDEPAGLEQFKEDLEDGDYDDEADMMKSYNEEWEEYKRDVAAYEKKIESGKFIRGFMIEGRDKGKYIAVTLKKDVKGKSSAAAVKGKEIAGTISAEDIKAEIERVKDREKRNKELDGEKIMPLVYEGFKKMKSYTQDSSNMILHEQIALLLMLADYSGYQTIKELYKAVGLTHGDDYKHMKLYNHLINSKKKDLQDIINKAVRVVILDKLQPHNGMRAESHGKAAALFELSKHYNEKEHKSIIDAQTDIRLKRESRVQDRLKKLSEQLKELAKPKAKESVIKEPAAGIIKKGAKGKGVKVLLKD